MMHERVRETRPEKTSGSSTDTAADVSGIFADP